MHRRLWQTALLAVLACPATSVRAADQPAPAPAAPASPFYSKLTLAGSTDYIPRGISLDGHQPAFEGMIEVGYKYRLYGIARLINASYSGATQEFDLAAGFRPVLSPFVLDFGVIHYDYGGVLAQFTEAYGAFVWPPQAGGANNRWGLSALGYWRTDGGGAYLQGDLSYILLGQASPAGLTPRLAISGRIAGVTDSAFDYLTYGGALTYTFTPGLTGELRYTTTNLSQTQCGGNLCDSRVMFTLTEATSLGAILTALHH